VFAISGFSGTGKTSVVESIVREVITQGYSVITVKSSQHEPKEGEETDTSRHQQAGATQSFFYGPANKNRSVKEIVDKSESDLLLIEGMKTSPLPKFWCIGKNRLEDTIPVGVKAIISWKPDEVEDKFEIPILGSDDTKQLVTILLTEAIELDETEV
jgi:molybdopterin-guanine dinucleotide biosynthesis protein MobB